MGYILLKLLLYYIITIRYYVIIMIKTLSFNLSDEMNVKYPEPKKNVGLQLMPINNSQFSLNTH